MNLSLPVKNAFLKKTKTLNEHDLSICKIVVYCSLASFYFLQDPKVRKWPQSNKSKKGTKNEESPEQQTEGATGDS